MAWGRDNRTCALRVVGHGPSLRLENRVAGADTNPYLALAALIAAGLHGVDQGLELEPALEGSAYEADKPQVPHTLPMARGLFADSAVAREAFGQEVVDHYLNRADVELAAFESAVTDWERVRGLRAPVIAVVEPATAQVMAEVPRAGVDETDAAVERAREAFPAWRALAPEERAEILHALAAALIDRREDLAAPRGAQRRQADRRRARRDGHGRGHVPLLRQRAAAAARATRSRWPAAWP